MGRCKWCEDVSEERVADDHEDDVKAYQEEAAKTAPRYASFFRIDVNWLLTGKGRRDSFDIEDLPPDAQAEVFNFIEFTRAKHPK